MIRRQHRRFIRNSFLAVCGILLVIFLIIAAMMVQFVDSSIENELVSLIHFTSGGLLETEDNEKEDVDLAKELGMDGPRDATVGGTRFPTYLFQIVQAAPDPEATGLLPNDQILQIRGERSYLDDEDSWRVLLDEMLKSTKRIDRIESEEFCYMVDRSGQTIHIAIVDYSGYSRFLSRLLIAGIGLILGFAGTFYLLLRFSANIFLGPAERAWESQERFVGDASHEIKTPLAIILSTAELGTSDDAEENDRRFGVIRDEARRINLLITRMLESTRIRSIAAQQRSNKVFSLSDALTECALRYESLLYEQGVTLYSDVGEYLYAFADENAFKQVISALLDNAGKYTPKGRIARMTTHKKRRKVIVTVRSEGVGVGETERANIFNRFYRADEGRAHVEGSYGLGLAIAKNLIETMGGSIRCESDGETFTDFIVTMRAVRPPKKA
ncbi:MAG: HAMP domain-containing histidine kinase [Clostridia bacterium]|nr:HAMP domain-containing histidine kinase [Clostridia bacterium]